MRLSIQAGIIGTRTRIGRCVPIAARVDTIVVPVPMMAAQPSDIRVGDMQEADSQSCPADQIDQRWCAFNQCGVLPNMALQMLAAERYCDQLEPPIRLYHIPIVGRMYRNRVARCVNLLPRGKRVLEVGYGSGVSFLALGEKFDVIEGIDLHQHGGAVRDSFDGCGVTLNLRRGSVLDLPYDDDSIDAALAISIHEHLHPADQATAFSEIHRVLKPGGCYVVGVPGFNRMMNTAYALLGYDIQQHHYSSERQVADAMGRSFELDVRQYRPTRWFKCVTTYLTLRGWK